MEPLEPASREKLELQLRLQELVENVAAPLPEAVK